MPCKPASSSRTTGKTDLGIIKQKYQFWGTERGACPYYDGYQSSDHDALHADSAQAD